MKVKESKKELFRDNIKMLGQLERILITNMELKLENERLRQEVKRINKCIDDIVAFHRGGQKPHWINEWT